MTKVAILNSKAIKEFRDIYKRELGIKLSNEEATMKAHMLFNLFKVISKYSNDDLANNEK